MGQQLGIPTDDVKMYAWIVSASWQRTEAPKLSEEEIWKSTHSKTKYTSEPLTYEETFKRAQDLFRRWRHEAEYFHCTLDEVPVGTKEELIKVLPLDGLRMWNGRKGSNSCYDHCPWKWDCDRIEGGL